MWNRFSRKRSSCQQVKNQLMAYLKGEGSPTRRQAIRDHLATCDACARAVRETEALEAQLVAEAARHRPILSLQASARIQERVYKRMRRRLIMRRTTQFTGRVVGLAVVLALIVGFSALWQWGPPEKEGSINSTAPTGEPVTITFACSDHDQGKYRQLADTFHQEHPSIAVQIAPSTAVFGKSENDLQELASSADSFVLQRSLEPQDIQSGLLRDLQPLAEADAAFDPPDFYPGLLDRFRWQGGLWGLPSPGYPLVIFYDKAAFDEAGLSHPQPPALSGAEGGWSFEEFETAARQLTKRQGEETSRFGLVISPRSLAGPILVLGRARDWAEGVSLLPQPILDSPAVVEAARWYVELAREQTVMPNPYELVDGPTPFVVAEVDAGKAATWDGWPAAYTLETYKDTYDLGIAPFPEGTPISDWVGASPYLMSAGTAHPDAVWQWLRFLTYQPGDVQDVRPPVRRSVAEESGYWAALGDDLSPTIRYVMERPKVALPPGMVDSLGAALEGILAEDQDVEEALAQAQRDLAEALEMPVSQAPPPPVPTSSQAETAVTSITFCPADYPFEHYKELAEVFQETHPEISVSVARDQVSLEGFAQDCDCFSYWSSYFPSAGEMEFALNLQPFVDADSNFPDDFYPGLLDACRWEGELWILPAYIDLPVIRYNKDLFDQMGVAYPQPGWTPDDFYERAVALTSGEGEDQVYGYMVSNRYDDTFDLNFFVGQHGGFAEYDGTDARFGGAPLKAAGTMAALQQYADLTRDATAPFPPETDFFSRLDLVAAQRVAMWKEWQTTDYYPGLSFPVGTAPLPLGQGSMPYQFVAYMISNQSTHSDACWEWIRFLLDQPVAAITGATARRSFVEAPEFVARVGEKEMASIRFSLEHLDSVPKRSNSWLHDAFQAIMDGTPVEVAVEEALRKDETFHACLDGVSGPLGMEDISACYKEAKSLSP